MSLIKTTWHNSLFAAAGSLLAFALIIFGFEYHSGFSTKTDQVQTQEDQKQPLLQDDLNGILTNRLDLKKRPEAFL